MKSALFKRVDLLRSDTFPKDIKDFSELPLEALKNIPDILDRKHSALTIGQKEEIVDKAADGAGVSSAALDHALDVANFFFKKFGHDGEAVSDQPETIADDIIEQGWVEKSKKDVLVAGIKTLKEKTPVFEAARRKRQYARGFLPSCTGLETSVDYRAVFKDSFNFGEEPRSYSPTYIGVVPMTILRLTFDQGLVKDVVFQADTETLRYLIANLIAAEREIESANQHLGLSPKR